MQGDRVQSGTSDLEMIAAQSMIASRAGVTFNTKDHNPVQLAHAIQCLLNTAIEAQMFPQTKDACFLTFRPYGFSCRRSVSKIKRINNFSPLPVLYYFLFSHLTHFSV